MLKLFNKNKSHKKAGPDLKQKNQEIVENEELSQTEIKKIKSFFEFEETSTTPDNELPNKKDYLWPIISEELKYKIAPLKDVIKYVEKSAKKNISSDFNKTAAYKIAYQKQLNDSQFKVATKLKGPMLVIAGAGSGKTRAIIYRVSFLLENKVNPERILLLTFTRKAAKEMLDRTAQLMGNNASSKVMGGTFHAFANSVLRRFGKMVNIQPNFTIIDTSDSADAISFVQSQLGIRKLKNKPFPNKNRLQAIISASRNKSQSIKEILEGDYPDFLLYEGKIKKIADAYAVYKRAANVLDYDDLLEVLRDKLNAEPEFRLKVQNLFDHILVDEYQDTNLVQHELLKILSEKHKNILAVGDDAQSIYRFRGANFENILKFPKEFPSCEIVLMEDNYRSNQEILAFSNAVINCSFLGYKKHLRAQREAGFVPQVIKFFDEQEEASFVADEIEKTQKKGIKLKQIAVLYRSSYHGNFIQAELMKRNIPFVTVGGIKFIERKHIKDVISYLRISVNNRDSIAWIRILTMLSGIGEVNANKIVSEIHHGTFNISNHSDKKYSKQLVKLFNMLISVKSLHSPKEKLDLIFKYYFPILESTEEDAKIRKLDLRALERLSEKYTSTESFINDFALEPPNQMFQNKDIEIKENDDHVILSTVHSAKGLEWHTVFIVHALDGLFPSYRSLKAIDELDEERRLFYVSATRAKEKLMITMPSYSASYNAFFTLPSRFLAEVTQKNELFDFRTTSNPEEN